MISPSRSSSCRLAVPWLAWLVVLFSAILARSHAAPPTTYAGDVYFGSGRPWMDVRFFGAVGDGVVDDTAAIQSAFDAALAVASQLDGNGQPIGVVPSVYFPVGNYRITSTLLWRCGTLQGANRNSKIIWGGAAGGVMLKNDTSLATYPQGLSQRGIYDMGFKFGANYPGCYLDLRGGPVEWGGKLDRVHCYGTVAPTDGGPAAAIRTDTIVNAHWRDMRFDQFFGYAIYIAQGAGAGSRSFSLDKFTIDTSGKNPNGFLRVEMADATSTLNIDLGNARLESNNDWTNAPAAIVSIAGNLGDIPALVTLHNIETQIGTVKINLVDQSPNTTPTTAASSVVIENVRSNVQNVLSGTWSSATTIPPAISGPMIFWATGRLDAAPTNPTLLQLGSFTVRNDGTVQLPNLTAFPSSNLAAGQLAMVNGKLYIRTSAAWVVVGTQN